MTPTAPICGGSRWARSGSRRRAARCRSPRSPNWSRRSATRFGENVRLMSIKVTPLEEASPRARNVAIGTFDGVHLGHRAVIEGADTVLTFEPHPLEVLRPEVAPKLINSLAVKRDVI